MTRTWSWLTVLLIAVLCLGTTGCGTTARRIGQETYAEVPPYRGPKARAAVVGFRNKATGFIDWRDRTGSAMADMLTAALFRSNKFSMLDRQDLDWVLEEQDFGWGGRVDPNTAAPVGRLAGAELLIVGAVTGFKDWASGVGGGVGFHGFGMGAGSKEIWMAMDIKVVDAATGEIVAMTSIEGSSGSVMVGGLIWGIPLPIGLGGWQGEPREKALRVCLELAARFLAAETPVKYFRY